MLSILKLKKILFKNFENQKIYVSTNGVISMNIYIDNAKIIANSKRIIIGNDVEKDFIIDLYKANKILIDKTEFKITFIFNDLEIEIQV